jgi:hypothetical protein
MAIKNSGDEEDRTSGLQLTTEETRATTAAPFHRFDGINAIPLDYDFTHLGFSGRMRFWGCIYLSIYQSSYSRLSGRWICDTQVLMHR